jgi:hypothetical protein
MGELEAELGYFPEVPLPLGSGPVLGVIEDADLHQVGLGEEPLGVMDRRLERPGGPSRGGDSGRRGERDGEKEG